MNLLIRRSSLVCFVTILVIAAGLAGCGNKEMGEAQAWSPQSLLILSPVQPTVQPTIKLTVQGTVQPPVQQTPTPSILGPSFDSNLDLRAGPVEVPLELNIPSLKVDAPMLGVGLTATNAMDAPKGDYGDPIWHTAFWYRGSGIPGEPGTATIAGHVNDLVGRPEIFAHLKKLKPGDVILIHVKNTNIYIRFIVDEVKVYSTQESSDPAVLAKIFGVGPNTGTEPQPTLDGLSHLTLITCAGYIVNGQFDHHTVVYATRSN